MAQQQYPNVKPPEKEHEKCSRCGGIPTFSDKATGLEKYKEVLCGSCIKYLDKENYFKSLKKETSKIAINIEDIDICSIDGIKELYRRLIMAAGYYAEKTTDKNGYRYKVDALKSLTDMVKNYIPIVEDTIAYDVQEAIERADKAHLEAVKMERDINTANKRIDELTAENAVLKAEIERLEKEAEKCQKAQKSPDA